ncbi:hypothetical protein COCVIDRAFT_13458 [Bipolaris victoriae FI3]|uniref:Uncharacterized protein n=1 Tax=Bipolaris victoriae (strain FI3) TaxID=930091 RepID=W7ESD7_BIPV3|nr:hypothetical protein COCVIDRAFT_13458 [Bipolaris victoriae FI3]
METRGSMGESREEPAPLTYMDRTATKKNPGLAATRYGGLFESTGPGDRTEGTPGCDAFQSEHPALGPGAAGWSSTTWARLVYACSCMTPALQLQWAAGSASLWQHGRQAVHCRHHAPPKQLLPRQAPLSLAQPALALRRVMQLRWWCYKGRWDGNTDTTPGAGFAVVTRVRLLAWLKRRALARWGLVLPPLKSIQTLPGQKNARWMTVQQVSQVLGCEWTHYCIYYLHMYLLSPPRPAGRRADWSASVIAAIANGQVPSARQSPTASFPSIHPSINHSPHPHLS